MILKIKSINKCYKLAKDINKNLYQIPVLSVDCGEIPLSALDSCRLMLLNLHKYVQNAFTENSIFNFDLFKSHVKIAQRLMDDLIDLEEEKINSIINKIENEDPEPFHIKQNEIEIWQKIKKSLLDGRRTGLGITSLGDVFAKLNIVYGSEQSLQMAKEIFSCLRDSAYLSSIEMSRDLGSFNVYDISKEINCDYLDRLWKDRPDLYELQKQYGRRNISLLTVAPAGSISILTQTTSGLEPVFRSSYTRRKKVNGNETPDFIDQNGVGFKEYKIYHQQLKNYLDEDSSRTEETSPWFNSTSDKINWKDSVKLQGVIQQYIDHSLSTTKNLPNNATVEDVAEIYLTAWQEGCKGITVYRDGSRSGILITEDSKDSNLQFKVKNDGVKRPKILDAEVHHIKIKNDEYYVVVGLMDNQPYEIFIGKYLLDDSGQKSNIPKCIKSGEVIKLKRGVYQLEPNECEIDKTYILSGYDECEEVESLARMTSLSLRHKIDLSYVVQSLEKNNGINNFPKAMARTLKKYIPKGTKVSGENCPQCGGENLTRQDGCILCKDCGYSKCN